MKVIKVEISTLVSNNKKIETNFIQIFKILIM
jgi:hypothetical protein